MIITRLREHAEREGLLADVAFEERKVRFVIEIDPTGKYLALREPPGRTVTKGKKEVTEAFEMLVPKMGNRNDGKTPCLLADTIGRVLVGHDEKDADRHTHANFVAWVGEAADATDDPACRAVLAFLETADADPESLASLDAALAEAKPKPGDWITFQVAGEGLVLRREAVKDHWRARFEERRAAKAQGKEPITCLACGCQAPAVDSHDKLRTVPGGNPSGVSLISADKTAFGSYGLKKSQTSPVCETCEAAYTRALQHLLDSDRTSYHDWDAQVAFAYWTREPEGDLFSLSAPDPQQVGRLIKSPYTPSGRETVSDPNEFYALSLSGVGGRAMIRDWIETTVPVVQANVAQWFVDLGIVLDRGINKDDKGNVPEGCEAGQIHHAWPLRALVRALGHKQSQGFEVPTSAPSELFQAAILGAPLSPRILDAATRRIRAEGSLHPARAALIKLTLNRLSRQRHEGGSEMHETLDESQANAGYRCGRLLAVLSRLQYLALGRTNATIVDRYYGAASTTPGAVFGRLLHLAQAHLAKLGATKPGAATNIRKDIEEITTRPSPLTEFPRQLTLEDQGRFALGFYHQQADYRSRSADEGGSEGEEPVPVPAADGD